MSALVQMGRCAALGALLGGAVGCMPAGGSAPLLGAGGVPLEPAGAGVQRWVCGDRFDGCGLLSGTECIHLEADLNAGTGSVSFGNGIVSRTQFMVDGIDRRWDWCPDGDGSFDCAFLISPDGDALHYNFRGSPDGRAKPSSFWSCARR